MESRTFDPEAVWQRMLENAEFAAQVPEGEPRTLWRELVGQLGEVIGDQMDAPLDVTSFLETKVRVARHFVATNFPERAVRAYPDDHPLFMLMDKKGVIAMTSAMYPKLVEMAERILLDVPEFLREQGITEWVFLSNKKGAGLEDEAIRAWRAGTLTVGGLLAMQPKTILSFTN